MAGLGEGSRLDVWRLSPAQHPFHHFQEGAQDYLFASVTPDEQPATIDRWMHFRVSCITALRACKTSDDLQPEMAAVRAREREREVEDPGCSYPLWAQARDATDLFAATVTNMEVRGKRLEEQAELIQIHPTQILKNATDKVARFRTLLRWPVQDGGPRARLSVGKHVLVMWSPRSADNVLQGPGIDMADSDFGASACGVVEDNPANRQQVLLGVDKDFSHEPPYWATH
jgi:hypothetical protein